MLVEISDCDEDAETIFLGRSSSLYIQFSPSRYQHFALYLQQGQWTVNAAKLKLPIGRPLQRASQRGQHFTLPSFVEE